MFKNLSYKFANLLIKNKVIENDDFEIYRCSEGDLKLIYKILNDQDTILDMRDYNTPEELIIIYLEKRMKSMELLVL